MVKVLELTVAVTTIVPPRDLIVTESLEEKLVSPLGAPDGCG
jgi:hypothetical protein